MQKKKRLWEFTAGLSRSFVAFCCSKTERTESWIDQLCSLHYFDPLKVSPRLLAITRVLSGYWDLV
jgi:hypothetical protein